MRRRSFDLKARLWDSRAQDEVPILRPERRDHQDPAPTVVPTANGGSLVAAALVKHNFGEKPCQGVEEPLHTITTQGNKFGLAAVHLTKFRKNSLGSGAYEPVHTVTANSFIKRRAAQRQWVSSPPS
jgi:hypothetical protein